jgi:hypothetical protein
MRAGWITLISEIKAEIKRINKQIEIETELNKTMAKYKDCPLKTMVIHQTVGSVRALEFAKKSLERLEELADPLKNQLTTDEWLLNDQRMKEIAQKAELDHLKNERNNYR